MEELLPDYVAELARNRYLTIQSLHNSYTLKKKFGKDRLESACKRLSGCPAITYTTIRNVLVNNLDTAGDGASVVKVPDNDYVRGAEAFTNF